ncbi:MAG: type II toxin-antitoxin system RelE/ParE family toxin [Dehalococcoidia bacterium]
MPWEVEFHPECEAWATGLTPGDQEQLAAAIRVLRQIGPALGRPLVDTVKGTRVRNLKELRPGSGGSKELRVLFAFDPVRRAILLVGGDKSLDWRGWYNVNIAVAEARWAEHLRANGPAGLGRRRRRER